MEASLYGFSAVDCTVHGREANRNDDPVRAGLHDSDRSRRGGLQAVAAHQHHGPDEILARDHRAPRDSREPGLADARPLKLWLTGEVGPKSAVVAERLRVVFRVVYSIAGMYSGATAATFLRSANPQLDDQSPLMLLREKPIEEVEAQIISATRALLEG